MLANGTVLVAGGLANLGTAASDLYDPDRNTWTKTGPLIQLRFDHSAVRLANGKVLVAGGSSQNYGSKLDTAELYDPQTGMWAPTGSLPYAPARPTLTLLKNGKVLIAGGSTAPGPNAGGESQTAAVYDPAAGTWSPTASMHTPRDHHTATLLDNGEVLVVGGANDPAAPTELYDPSQNVWKSSEAPLQPPLSHTATLMPAGPASVCAQACGSVVVAGGRDAAGGYALSATEIYRTATIAPVVVSKKSSFPWALVAVVVSALAVLSAGLYSRRKTGEGAGSDEKNQE